MSDKSPRPLFRLMELMIALAALKEFSEEQLKGLIETLAAENGIKTSDYIHPARLALTGKTSGPSFYGLLRVLGRDRVIWRLENLIAGEEKKA